MLLSPIVSSSSRSPSCPADLVLFYSPAVTRLCQAGIRATLQSLDTKALRIREVWVSAGKELGLRASRVAIIATAAGIDQIAAQSNQRLVFAFQIQGHRRDFKAQLDSRLRIVLRIHMR